jgi:hypothetical protein
VDFPACSSPESSSSSLVVETLILEWKPLAKLSAHSIQPWTEGLEGWGQFDGLLMLARKETLLDGAKRVVVLCVEPLLVWRCFFSVGDPSRMTTRPFGLALGPPSVGVIVWRVVINSMT